MGLKTISNLYQLLLAIGALYVGILMFLGSGVFATFPPEWIGTMPFTNWSSLAIVGIIIFGIGNAFVSTYGFITKKGTHKTFFLLTITMGLLLFLSALTPVLLVGEWYLPTALFWLLSFIQLSLGLLGFVTKKS
ncbi:hypothetical protein [Oceanobacillus halotolerans]|uniref:hypothetical protein n=1 Tax=Oceanobacillus halotolerans TaxID=2663380 RepID=UPI0013D9FD8F|nr:hypothetical protein [Oceanobacillus halotolerans]